MASTPTKGGNSDNKRSSAMSPGAAAAEYPNTSRFPSDSLTTLVSIADAFLPSLEPPTAPTLPTSTCISSLIDGIVDDSPQNTANASAGTTAAKADTTQKVEALKRFWTHSLNVQSSPDYVEAICTAILIKLPSSVRSNLLILLKLLSNPFGTSLVLCYPCTSSFAAWKLEDRVWALQRLRDSRLDKHREAFCGLKRLLCGVAMSYVDTTDGDCDSGKGKKKPWELNPYWEAMSYGGPIHSYVPPKRDAELIKEGTTFDFEKHDAILDVDHILDTTASGEKVLTYDVVIVGSGCGGGVSAATLAQAGYSVLVIEKGPYVAPDKLSNLESEMFDQLYEQSSLLTTTDGNIMILAGSGLGGGTAINWGCCLDTPLEVRKEWADVHGLEHFRPLNGGVKTEFDTSMAAIKERIGVTSPPSSGSKSPKKKSMSSINHNGMNEVMVAGCEGMGYKYQVTGQNLRHTETDAAGYTCFGDRYGNKQSGIVTYLADAGKAGAKILPNCTVTKILKTKDKACGRYKANGVLARIGSQKIRVYANRCVICSAGSLNTPCVLLKSGFKNRHIGRHLHLHPVTCAIGLMPKDKVNKPGGSKDDGGVISMLTRSLTGSRRGLSILHPAELDGSVLGWVGAPMTTVCSEFASGPDDDGYGARLECPSAHSGLMGAGISWQTPSQFKETLGVAKNAVTLIVLQRDHSEGRVQPDTDGRPQISYALEERDKRSMMQALCGAMSLLAEAGATYLMSSNSDDDGFNLENLADDEKEEAVNNYRKSIVGRGMPKYTMSVFSAHQMCTCRMGSSPSSSAADEDGELWECDNLYVADASTLPTASGANPMLTTLATSYMISNRIALRLKYEDDRLGDVNEGDLFNVISQVARRDDRRERAGSLVQCVLNLIFSRWAAYFVATVASAAVLAAWRDGNLFLI